jgi:hypothetical protein
MGGKAERQAGVADRLEVGVDEVFLAEMQVLSANSR